MSCLPIFCSLSQHVCPATSTNDGFIICMWSSSYYLFWKFKEASSHLFYHILIRLGPLHTFSMISFPCTPWNVMCECDKYVFGNMPVHICKCNQKARISSRSSLARTLHHVASLYVVELIGCWQSGTAHALVYFASYKILPEWYLRMDSAYCLTTVIFEHGC